MCVCVSVSDEMKCLSRVTDSHTDAFHQRLAIIFTSVKQILYSPWHPSGICGEGVIMKCHKQTNARPRQPVHRYRNPAHVARTHHTVFPLILQSTFSSFQVFSLVREQLPGRCPFPVLHCAGLLVERSCLSDAIKMFFH